MASFRSGPEKPNFDFCDDESSFGMPQAFQKCMSLKPAPTFKNNFVCSTAENPILTFGFRV